MCAKRSTRASAPRTSRRWSITWPGGWTTGSTARPRATAGRSVRPTIPAAPGVSVEHSDFRFDPETGAFEPISGIGPVRQHVRRLGQPVHLRRVAPDLAAGPAAPRAGANPYLAVPSAVNDIAGGSVPIFRISPVEAWRQIRSSRRVAHSVRTPGIGGRQPPRRRRRRRRDGLSRQRLPGGVLRQRLRRRRPEQPDPPADPRPRRPHVQGGPRPSRAGDGVRPLVGQLVPAREFRERAGRHALRPGHEPRRHRSHPHPARRGQAPRPEARARPGPDLPDRPARVPLHAAAAT